MNKNVIQNLSTLFDYDKKTKTFFEKGLLEKQNQKTTIFIVAVKNEQCVFCVEKLPSIYAQEQKNHTLKTQILNLVK